MFYDAIVGPFARYSRAEREVARKHIDWSRYEVRTVDAQNAQDFRHIMESSAEQAGQGGPSLPLVCEGLLIYDSVAARPVAAVSYQEAIREGEAGLLLHRIAVAPPEPPKKEEEAEPDPVVPASLDWSRRGMDRLIWSAVAQLASQRGAAFVEMEHARSDLKAMIYHTELASHPLPPSRVWLSMAGQEEASDASALVSLAGRAAEAAELHPGFLNSGAMGHRPFVALGSLAKDGSLGAAAQCFMRACGDNKGYGFHVSGLYARDRSSRAAEALLRGLISYSGVDMGDRIEVRVPRAEAGWLESALEDMGFRPAHEWGAEPVRRAFSGSAIKDMAAWAGRDLFSRASAPAIHVHPIAEGSAVSEAGDCVGERRVVLSDGPSIPGQSGGGMPQTGSGAPVVELAL